MFRSIIVNVVFEGVPGWLCVWATLSNFSLGIILGLAFLTGIGSGVSKIVERHVEKKSLSELTQYQAKNGFLTKVVTVTYAICILVMLVGLTALSGWMRAGAFSCSMWIGTYCTFEYIGFLLRARKIRVTAL